MQVVCESGLTRGQCGAVSCAIVNVHRRMTLIDGQKPAFARTADAWNAVIVELKKYHDVAMSQWAETVLLPHMKSNYIRLRALYVFLEELANAFAHAFECMKD